MVIFYKNYPYAPRATLVSAAGSLFALLAAVFGIVLAAGSKGKIGMILGGVALLALAVFLFFYVSRKLPDKISEKDSAKNIQTKASYGKLYVNEHPDQYDYIRSVNPAFAAKYTRNEAGKIVKIK